VIHPSTRLDSLPFTPRAVNVFFRAGVETAGELVAYRDPPSETWRESLLRVPNCGLKTIREIEHLVILPRDAMLREGEICGELEDCA
jgi:hypothetical protein